MPLLKKDITILATGTGLKRYINICHHHHIHIKNLKYSNNTYIFEINADDYKRTKEFIKSTGIRTNIIKKQGIPFRLNQNRNRYGLILGIIIFFTGLLFLSKFIWQIDINGNIYYSDEEILDYLSYQNIRIGSATTINNEVLETGIRSVFDQIIWVSVSVDGTKLTIDVKEDNSNPILPENDEIRDIVATKDGVIESIFVRTGTAIVKVGDEVKKGDVLVTSKVVCKNEFGEEVKEIYTAADADIVISTSYEYNDTILRTYEEKGYTGNVMKEELVRIGNREVATDFKCNYEHYDILVEYTSQNEYFPVLYGYKYYREYQIISKSYTDETLTKLLEENLANYLNILQENSIQITNKSVKIDLYGLSGSATGTIHVLEDATAYEKPIITRENEGT